MQFNTTTAECDLCSAMLGAVGVATPGSLHPRKICTLHQLPALEMADFPTLSGI
jgi:hypothetical protein